MSTIEKLLAQKQQLMEQLASEPGANGARRSSDFSRKSNRTDLARTHDPVGRGE
jgi:hypothetical protein